MYNYQLISKENGVKSETDYGKLLCQKQSLDKQIGCLEWLCESNNKNQTTEKPN
jgi:hypothetical protein